MFSLFNFVVFCLFWFSGARCHVVQSTPIHYVAKADLEFLILFPCLSPKCWVYRDMPLLTYFLCLHLIYNVERIKISLLNYSLTEHTLFSHYMYSQIPVVSIFIFHFEPGSLCSTAWLQTHINFLAYWDYRHVLPCQVFRVSEWTRGLCLLGGHSTTELYSHPFHLLTIIKKCS